MNKRIDIWTSISSVLYGDCTEEERQVVESWVANSEKNKKFLDRLQNSSFREGIEQDAVAAKERVFLLVQEKKKRMRLVKRLRFWQATAVAAIFLFLVVSGIILTQKTAAPAVYLESKSPAGSTSRLTLSDGTIVELNAGSTIRYPQTFQGNDRTVTLIGEACFDVAQDPKRPFFVNSNHVKIKALGTCFNVKAYDDDDKAMVTLMEGAVSVDIEQQGSFNFNPVVLKSNQQVIFNKPINEVQVLDVNAEFYAAWRNGICFFENEKMVDIARILSRQYGVNVKVLSENLENQLFSGFFNKQEGLFHILNSFKKNRNFEYQQTEYEIEIYEI